MGALQTNRLMKFGCTCGETYRVIVRATGDSFRCRSCKVQFVFPERSRGTSRDDSQEVTRLKAELAAEREARLELAERKTLMEKKWVEQTLALYLEFETSLRPQLRKAEAGEATLKARVDVAESALCHSQEELDAAWKSADQHERSGRKTLDLLARSSGALKTQLRLLKELRPVLEACLNEPGLLEKTGVDALFTRAALLKCLELTA
jgi:hypothetical protein